jgi:hypothetical protein
MPEDSSRNREMLTTNEPIVPAQMIDLFNGRDLTGWTADMPERDTDPTSPDIYTVRDGFLVGTGEAVGHLVSTGIYKNYRLVVEYRLPEGGGGSVLVHVSRLRALRTKSKNIFPQSIDIKLREGDVGDIYCVIENIQVSDESRRPREVGQVAGGAETEARHIVKLARAEHVDGNWNTFVLEARGHNIDIWVNDVLVNSCFDCTTDNGKIALQANPTPVEIRKVAVYPLAASDGSE